MRLALRFIWKSISEIGSGLLQFSHRRVEQMIRLLQVVEGPVHPAAAPVKVATGFGGQQVIVRADDELPNVVRLANGGATLVERLLHLPVVITRAPHLVESLLLQQRTGPLREVAAPVMLRVP